MPDRDGKEMSLLVIMNLTGLSMSSRLFSVGRPARGEMEGTEEELAKARVELKEFLERFRETEERRKSKGGAEMWLAEVFMVWAEKPRPRSSCRI